MSAYIFWLILALSILLVLCFFWGTRKNLTLAKEMSERLEAAFRPKDKNYIWLGGVMGFAAEFKMEDFEKVYINFRLLPRQSILWLPFSLLLGRRDSIQLLFYLKSAVSEEYHVVKKTIFKPAIRNGFSKKKRGKFLVFFRKKDLWEKLNPLLEVVSEKLYHLALSPEENVVFIELRGFGLHPWLTEEKLFSILKAIRAL